MCRDVISKKIKEAVEQEAVVVVAVAAAAVADVDDQYFKYTIIIKIIDLFFIKPTSSLSAGFTFFVKIEFHFR